MIGALPGIANRFVLFGGVARVWATTRAYVAAGYDLHIAARRRSQRRRAAFTAAGFSRVESVAAVLDDFEPRALDAGSDFLMPCQRSQRILPAAQDQRRTGDGRRVAPGCRPGS